MEQNSESDIEQNAFIEGAEEYAWLQSQIGLLNVGNRDRLDYEGILRILEEHASDWHEELQGLFRMIIIRKVMNEDPEGIAGFENRAGAMLKAIPSLYAQIPELFEVALAQAPKSIEAICKSRNIDAPAMPEVKLSINFSIEYLTPEGVRNHPS